MPSILKFKINIDTFQRKVKPNIMNEENLVDIEKIKNILIRRKKLLLSIFFFGLIFGTLQLGYNRIFKPKYKGSFSLLIQNPIKSSDSNQAKPSAFDLSSIARNNLKTDIETLKAFLTSPTVINDVAVKNGQTAENLEININRD